MMNIQKQMEVVGSCLMFDDFYSLKILNENTTMYLSSKLNCVKLRQILKRIEIYAYSSNKQ